MPEDKPWIAWDEKASATASTARARSCSPETTAPATAGATRPTSGWWWAAPAVSRRTRQGAWSFWDELARETILRESGPCAHRPSDRGRACVPVMTVVHDLQGEARRRILHHRRCTVVSGSSDGPLLALCHPHITIRHNLLSTSPRVYRDSALSSSWRTFDRAAATSPAGTATIPSPHIRITKVNSLPPAVMG